MATKIIRYCVLEEEHNGDNVFKVHRPFPLGNPYTHIKNKETKALVKVSTRQEAINLYGPYFDKMLKYDEDFKKEFERMVDAYYNFDEIYIGCYCKLNETCHSDIIIKKIQQYVTKKHIEELLKDKKLKKYKN